PYFLTASPTPEISILSLHDALPISIGASELLGFCPKRILPQIAHGLQLTELKVRELNWSRRLGLMYRKNDPPSPAVLQLMAILRSEEHTSELQSLTNLVCRLLLEKT